MAIESLVLGREKRATAGNRMRALLDKAHSLEAEEGFEEVADDDDFEGIDEQDEFEEDFESTDEEEGAVDGDVDEDAEKRLRREEKAARRAERGKSTTYLDPRKTPSTDILRQQGYNLNSPEFSYLKKFPKRRPSGLRKEIKVGEASGSGTTAAQAEDEGEGQAQAEGSGSRLDIDGGDDQAGREDGDEAGEPPKKRRRVSFHPSDPAAPSPSGSNSRTPSPSPSADPQGIEGSSPAPSDMEEGPSVWSTEKVAGRRQVWEHRLGDVKRKSSMRATTLANKQQVDKRLQGERVKKANYVSRYVPRDANNLTQADYISLALITEEENRESLKDWLEKEEERKRLARMERRIVAGPRISWVSRRIGGKVKDVVEEVEVDEDEVERRSMSVMDVDQEQEKIVVAPRVDKGKGREMDLPMAQESSPLKHSAMDAPDLKEETPAEKVAELAAAISTSQDELSTIPAPIALPPPPTLSPTPTTAAQPDTTPTPAPGTDAQAMDVDAPAPTPAPDAITTQSESITAATPAGPPAPNPADVPAEPAPPSEYTRNYVILSQIPGGQKAELRVLFGDQGDWTNMPHIPTRNRPLTRRAVICPITGLPAKYRHPTNHMPYATAAAYKTIEDILHNRYTWSSHNHAYLNDVETIGTEQSDAADGLKEDGVEGWDEACRGWWEP